MSRSIQVGDGVKISLPPETKDYTITAIVNSLILVQSEVGDHQGIVQSQLDGKVKVIGTGDTPYRVEFYLRASQLPVPTITGVNPNPKIKPVELDYMVENQIPIEEELIKQILVGNNLISIKWLLDHQYNISQKMINKVAKQELLPVLVLLAEYNLKPNLQGLNKSLHGSDLQVPTWILSQGIVPDQETMDMAVKGKHLDLIQWIYQNYQIYPGQGAIMFSFNTFTRDPKCPLLEWLVQFIHLYPKLAPDQRRGQVLIHKALQQNCLVATRYLLDRGYLPNEQNLDDLIDENDLDVEAARLLYSKGVRLSDESLNNLTQIFSLKPDEYFFGLRFSNQRSETKSRALQVYKIFTQ